MKRYSESEYYYSSAKIAAKSARLIKEREMSELCDSPDLASAADRVRGFGIPVLLTDDKPDVELTLTSFAADSYKELRSFLPDPEAVSIFTARFDCHNLKTGIKCVYMGVDPEPYYLNCGSVGSKALKAFAEEHDYSAFPVKLAEAASRLDKKLYESGNIRELESGLDSACYSYMSALAKELSYKPLSELLKLKIDLTNILTVFRLLALKNSDTVSMLLQDSLLAGGSTEEKCFIDNGKPCFPDALVGKALSHEAAVRIKEASKNGLGELSCEIDRIFIEATKEKCGGPLLGILPVAEYIIMLEYQIKNLRIVLSGISAGASPEKLRGELRY